MPHSYGYRARTRKLFAKDFRKHGMPAPTVGLRSYHLGDHVDIKVNPTIHKGMPFRYYHGRTGRVWNVGKRSIGVELNKRVRHRVIRKRLYVRVEHIQQSNCRKEFLARCKENTRLRVEAKGKKQPRLSLKRLPKQPKTSEMVQSKIVDVTTLQPLKYDPVW